MKWKDFFVFAVAYIIMGAIDILAAKLLGAKAEISDFNAVVAAMIAVLSAIRENEE